MSDRERPPEGDEAAVRADLVAEAQRMLSICNACRYCEGYCAVFPALERRLSFAERDVHYLANLCHNCGACFYACQYAPPHEFELNLPRALALVRKETYRKYAWPGILARSFERNGTVVAIVATLSFAFFVLLTAWVASPTRFVAAFPDAQGSFYALLPHSVMVGTFGTAFVVVIAALALSFRRFRASIRERPDDFSDGAASLLSAGLDAVTLRYLDGGGDGCTYPSDKPSFARRNFHHLAFYGFIACFAATVVATFDHYALKTPAPYPFFSAPVLLGTLGGLSLAVGTAGLLILALRRDPDLGAGDQHGMDFAFMLLLFMIAVTGLSLLALRETRAMGMLLAIHLGAVMALFLTLPYGKFVHAIYRVAALVQFHRERGKTTVGTGME